MPNMFHSYLACLFYNVFMYSGYLHNQYDVIVVGGGHAGW